MYSAYCVEEELNKIKYAFEANGYPGNMCSENILKMYQEEEEASIPSVRESGNQGKKSYSCLMLGFSESIERKAMEPGVIVVSFHHLPGKGSHKTMMSMKSFTAFTVNMVQST